MLPFRSTPPFLDHSLDPDFGFSADIDPPPAGGRRRASDGAGATGQVPTLQEACDAIAEAVVVLRAPAAARTLVGLARRVEDAADPLSDVARRGYLLGEGAGRLQAMARLAVDERIAPDLRREQLAQAGQAVELCLNGLAIEWDKVVHRLSCAAGGVTQAAALRRAELVRQTLMAVARTTLGRDPAEGGRTLTRFESHYVAGLGRRLHLPEALALPPDPFLDADAIDAAVVERARRALQTRVTPAAVVWSMAQEAIEELRHQLVESGADPARLECLTPVQADVQEAGIAAIERRLGPVDRWTLFRQEDDTAPVQLQADPTCLAVQGLLNLMAEGAVPVAEIGMRRRLWREGEPQRLRHLTDGLWWMQAGTDPRFDAGMSTPVGPRELQALDRLPLLVFTDAECAALARSAVLAGSPRALQGLSPRWLADPALAARWWQRLGPGRCRKWLHAQYLHALPSDTRHALIRAADEAGHPSAFERLRPVGPDATARAWRACDGVDAVMVAVRGGDDARLHCWMSLLRTAAPALSGPERGQALTARDDQGRAALAHAMSRVDGEAAVGELTSGIQAMRAAGLPLEPDVVDLLGGGGRIWPTGVATALAVGGAQSISTFIDAAEAALGKPSFWFRQPLRDLRRLVLSANSVQDAHRLDGFALAMKRNHAEAVGVWMNFLLRLRRRGVLDAQDFVDAAGVPRDDGRCVYHAAMAAGSAQAAATYRGVLRTARKDGLLPRESVSRLLLGDGDGAHAPSLAAAAGHVAALREHLEAEKAVLGLSKSWTQSLVDIQRWARQGGHAAIGAAMLNGQVEAVRVLTAHAGGLLRDQWKGVLFPSFQGRPGHVSALCVAVTAGRLDVIDVWFDALTTLVAEGRVRHRDMLTLLSGRRGKKPGLFDAEALWAPTPVLDHLLACVVDSALKARWRSSHVVRLLGAGAGQHPVLVAALAQGHADAVRVIGASLLRLHAQGTLDGRDLRRLLSLKDARRRIGMDAVEAAMAAYRAPDPRAVSAYAALILEAEARGLLRAKHIARWTTRR